MPLIRMETNPTVAMLYDCWGRIAADPGRTYCLADTDPQNVAEFLALSGDTILPCIAYMRDEPAALAWLSHIAMTAPTMTPVSAQMHLYLLPDWRTRPISPECAAIIRNGLESYGFAHLFAMARTDDVATRKALDACRFAWAATLPRWQRYGGVWGDMDVYDYHFDCEG